MTGLRAISCSRAASLHLRRIPLCLGVSSAQSSLRTRPCPLARARRISPVLAAAQQVREPTASGSNSAPAPAPHPPPQEQQDWELEIEELQKLVSLLPVSVRSAVEEHPEMTQLLEVVLDLGRPPLARFPSGDKKLSTVAVTREDLEYAIEQVGDFGGDNRAGIDRTLHRISCMRNRRGTVIGLTCRVGRAIWGSAELVRDLVEAGSSILFLGRPGVGKTTAIREVSRTLSEALRKRVVIVDTSNEIGGDGDIPHDGIGRARRMQVRDPELQHRVMVEAVENHTPEVIIIDEIGTEAECVAARTIAQRGVQLVATAHGNELENLVKNPSLADLIGGIQSVTLGDEEAKRRGVQKSVLERAAPPTFDVAVEMISRTKWKIHLDVAQAVDALLAGGHPGGQLREKTADGSIQKSTQMPQRPGTITRHTTQNGGPDGAAGGRKKTGRRETEREQRLQRERGPRELPQGRGSGTNEGGSSSSGTNGFTLTLSTGSYDAMQSPFDGDDDWFAPSSRAGPARGQVDVEEEDEDDEEDGVSCFRARKLRSWQAAAGVIDDRQGTLTRLLPFDLDPDRMWEVMTALDLVDKIFICDRVDDADAVLGLRPRMRTASALRQAAKAQRVPIYAIKNMSAPSLARALRSLLGMEPSVAGPATSAPGRRRSYPLPQGSDNDDDDEFEEEELHIQEDLTTTSSSSPAVTSSSSSRSTLSKSSSPRPSPSSRRPSYASLMEAEALEEVEAAIEAIVRPLKQPVELLPRAPEVMRAQMELVARYDLAHEVVGTGVDARLRILSTSPLGAVHLKPLLVATSPVV